LQKNDVDDMVFTDAGFVYSNQLYWGASRNAMGTESAFWRWGGSNFEAVDRVAMERCLKGEDRAQTLLHEGWTVDYFDLDTKKTGVNVFLSGTTISVYAKVVPNSIENGDHVKIIFNQLGEASVNDVLADIPLGFRRINKEEFLNLGRVQE